MNRKESIIMTKSGSKLISHRGNITGKTKHENDPEYIISALDQGFDVELDVSFRDNNFWLGHDEKKYKVNIDFLNNDRLWCHLKNKECLKQIVDVFKNENIHYFWHTTEDFVITSRGHIWHHSKCFKKDNFTCKSVAVLPEIFSWSKKELSDCYGICSDYIKEYA